MRLTRACISFVRLCEVHDILEIRMGCRRHQILLRIWVDAQVVNMAMANGLSDEHTDLGNGLVGRWHLQFPEEQKERNKLWGHVSRTVAADRETNRYSLRS